LTLYAICFAQNCIIFPAKRANGQIVPYKSKIYSSESKNTPGASVFRAFFSLLPVRSRLAPKRFNPLHMENFAGVAEGRQPLRGSQFLLMKFLCIFKI